MITSRILHDEGVRIGSKMVKGMMEDNQKNSFFI